MQPYYCYYCYCGYCDIGIGGGLLYKYKSIEHSQEDMKHGKTESDTNLNKRNEESVEYEDGNAEMPFSNSLRTHGNEIHVCQQAKNLTIISEVDIQSKFQQKSSGCPTSQTSSYRDDLVSQTVNSQENGDMTSGFVVMMQSDVESGEDESDMEANFEAAYHNIESHFIIRN